MSKEVKIISIKRKPGNFFYSNWRNPVDIVTIEYANGIKDDFVSDPYQNNFQQLIGETIKVFFNSSRGLNWISFIKENLKQGLSYA